MGAVTVTAACRPYWNYQVVDLAEGAVVPGGEFADFLLATGAPVEPVDEQPQPGSGGTEVPGGSVAEVLAWVDGDHDRATQALAAEQAKGNQARSTLVAVLDKLLADN